MDPSTRRHVLWVARAMARTDLSPLRPADVLDLERVSEVRGIDAGTRLMQAGDPITEVHVVRGGRVQLAVRRPMAGRQVVGIVGPGGVIGDIPVFCEVPMPFDAIADVRTTVLSIPRDELVDLLGRSPGLSLRWMTSVAKRFEQTQRRMITLLTKDLAAQVATVLLDQRQPAGGGTWTVPLPHQVIAALLGVRRQSVSRVMADLRRRGLVEGHYGRIELLDLGGLADIAGERLDDIECGADERQLATDQ